ncbi:competence type IV pilus minor pilin ComGG [Pseudobacillus wudalianchiensis]|uniref:Competence protein ComG n=1 Tax=Pseudobacillus wudalianchiensis TaxID=1743143 RepID=A0A1B9B972_9BACI|nr:competence type IV pilus minor pilin ComGG [Bacillus wudalianchiensis]OCA92622.1 hypothetical protein A8F95_02705 [Bacillus wudalianchiensis]
MKSLISNEKGVLLPYTILLFTVVCTAAMFGTGIFVSKQKTALFLTDYYETKVIEFMALQEIFVLLENGEEISGIYRTDRGDVTYKVIPDETEELVAIHLKTAKAETRFSTRVIYSMADRQIVRWIE